MPKAKKGAGIKRLEKQWKAAAKKREPLWKTTARRQATEHTFSTKGRQQRKAAQKRMRKKPY